MHLCISVHAYANTYACGGKELMLDVFLNSFPLAEETEEGFLTEPRVHKLADLHCHISMAMPCLCLWNAGIGGRCIPMPA